MSKSTKSILEQWLHPLAVDDFLDRYWTRDAYWGAPNEERLRFTQDLLPDLELSALLEYAIDPIKVWYVDGDRPVYSLTLGRKEAYHAYRAGLTLYFHLDASVSARLVMQVSRELARPPMMFKVSVFANRTGGQTMPHVDGNENFTVQLKGKKRWRISCGSEWPGIQERWKNNQNGLVRDLCRIKCPPESWNEIEPLEMTPGAFLYFPADYWHTVESMEDSLSLNVSIERSYAWADALLPVIRTTLVRNVEWSSPDVGLWSSGNQRKDAESKVSNLLNRLGDDLHGIDGDHILAAWNAVEAQNLPEEIPPNFVRNPFVSCVITSATPQDEFKIRVESTVRRGTPHFLSFPWAIYPAFLKLVCEPSVQESNDFKESPDLVLELLRYGVLRPC